MNNYNKLKPLIGIDGIPIKDSNNNYIILDDNNKPIKDTGISVLVDESGKPVLNSLGNPILLDSEGKPLNESNQNIYYTSKDPQNKIKSKPLPYERIKENGQAIGYDKIVDNLPEKKIKVMKYKKGKGTMSYSECNPQSLKKINFMRPYQSPFYDENEYKSSCFACDVGCSISKSGYSPMNFSPYNNLIRRRNITPLTGKNKKKKKNNKNNKNNKKKNSNINKVNLNKIKMENENYYYLTED